MKKLFTNLKVALTLLLLCGVCSVWAEEHAGTFRKITSADDLTTGYYVIVASSSATANEYALGATANSNKRIDGVQVSISNNSITNPSTTIVYLITKNASGYSFKNESTGTYMHQVSTTSGKGMGFQETEVNMTLAGYNSTAPIGFKFTLDGTSNNIFKYNNGSKWFANYSGAYASDMTPVELYKEDAPVYDIVAQSNNTVYGTVLLNGSKIIASPNEGYRISLTNPYTLLSGSATVTPNGNEFTVAPSSDCNVQINFEAIPKHTVTWSVNGEVSSEQVAEGTDVIFKTPALSVMGCSIN